MSEGARGVAVLVAYYAPPAVGIASQRLAEFVRYLPDFGWDPVVVAPKAVHYHRSEGGGLPPGVRVERVPNPEPSRFFRRLAGAGQGAEMDSGPHGIHEVAPVTSGPVAGWLRRLIREWLYVPDAQALWIPGASRAAGRMVGEAGGRPVVLFSTSVPFSTHFAARKAARERGAPWVAEYRDPWSVAPPQFGRHTTLRTHLDRRLDHDVVAAADHVVVTSTSTRDLFLAGFPRLEPQRVSVVRNGWGDAPAPGDPPPGPGSPLRLVYTGTLLRASWAGPFMEALVEVEGADPGSVTLDIYGPEHPWTEVVPDALRPQVVRLHGLIPGDDVPAVLAGASAVVILQPDAVRYVPGKIYEYIGARRPILAGIPGASEVADLAREHGDARVVDPMTGPALAEAVRVLLRQHRAGELQVHRVEAERVAPLSRRAQVRRLAQVFQTVARVP